MVRNFLYAFLAGALLLCPAIAAAESSNESGPQLTIELTDGSLIIGTGLSDPLSFHSNAMGDFKMKWADIRSLEYPLANGANARLIAANGDVYEVQITTATISAVTKFGQKDIPVKLLRSVRVAAGSGSAGSPKPEVTESAKLQLTVELVDGSSIVGDPPDQPLGFHTDTLGDTKLPWSSIREIKIDDDKAHLTATNGDQITGKLILDTLHLETSFGKVDLPIKNIRNIEVSHSGQAGAHLIGWWKMDEGSGTVIKDSNPGPTAHDGTALNGNGPTWYQCTGYNCLQFNGNQTVSFGNVLQDGYPQITVTCWAKAEPGGLGMILERGSWDQPDGLGLGIEDDALFGHWIANPGGVTVRSHTHVQDSQWHHFAGTMARDNTGYVYRIYVDGQLLGTETSSMGLTATTGGWASGTQFGSWGFRGMMKDLRIYDRALTESQIKSIYAEQPSLASSPAPPPIPSPTPSLMPSPPPSVIQAGG